MWDEMADDVLPSGWRTWKDPTIDKPSLSEYLEDFGLGPEDTDTLFELIDADHTGHLHTATLQITDIPFSGDISKVEFVRAWPEFEAIVFNDSVNATIGASTLRESTMRERI